MSKDLRNINGRVFEIRYDKDTNKAEVYENNELCFEMNGEFDTDTENEYIKCWCNLENN